MEYVIIRIVLGLVFCISLASHAPKYLKLSIKLFILSCIYLCFSFAFFCEFQFWVKKILYSSSCISSKNHLIFFGTKIQLFCRMTSMRRKYNIRTKSFISEYHITSFLSSTVILELLLVNIRSLTYKHLMILSM